MGVQQYLASQVPPLPLLSQVIVDGPYFYAFSNDRTVGWVNKGKGNDLFRFVHAGTKTYMNNNFDGSKPVPSMDEPGVRSQQGNIDMAVQHIHRAIERGLLLKRTDMMYVSADEFLHHPALLLQMIDARQASNLYKVIEKCVEDDKERELVVLLQPEPLHLMERIAAQDGWSEELAQTVILLLYLIKRHSNAFTIPVPSQLLHKLRRSIGFLDGLSFNNNGLYRGELINDGFLFRAYKSYGMYRFGFDIPLPEWVVYSVEQDEFVPMRREPGSVAVGAAEVVRAPGESGRKKRKSCRKNKKQNKSKNKKKSTKI